MNLAYPDRVGGKVDYCVYANKDGTFHVLACDDDGGWVHMDQLTLVDAVHEARALNGGRFPHIQIEDDPPDVPLISERVHDLRAALRKVLAHTAYLPGADRAFLAALLASIQRIAGDALEL